MVSYLERGTFYACYNISFNLNNPTFHFLFKEHVKLLQIHHITAQFLTLFICARGFSSTITDNQSMNLWTNLSYSVMSFPSKQMEYSPTLSLCSIIFTVALLIIVSRCKYNTYFSISHICEMNFVFQHHEMSKSITQN